MYSNNSNSEAVANFIKRRKANLRKVFHSKCCLCGFSEVQEALEFHHVNPEEKEFQICGSNNQTKALKKQLEEMKKTILVCSNCHKGIHNNIYQVPDNWTEFYDDKIAQELLDDLEKIKTHQINYCQRCGKEITSISTYCSECFHIMQRKCDRPNREELKDLIYILPFTQIASKYGVTDNAVRKWCKSYNLPSTKKEINLIKDQEWEKI